MISIRLIYTTVRVYFKINVIDKGVLYLEGSVQSSFGIDGEHKNILLTIFKYDISTYEQRPVDSIYRSYMPLLQANKETVVTSS